MPTPPTPPTPRPTALTSKRTVGVASIILLAVGLMGGGCVKQGVYDNLRENNMALTARNHELQEMLKTREAAIAELQARMSGNENTLGSASATQRQLQAELARLRAEYNTLASRLAGIQFGPLDAATDEALQQLATQYPELIEYDPSRGALRFKSDITFASGSFELSGQGQQAVAALGRVLAQLPSAQQYDIVVVGHTDGQRVSQRAGRPFKDNDELSAFRAISVTRAIAGSGVDKRRVMFAGFGESRPSIANAGNGNTPGNRRVEVFLTRALPTGGASETTAPAETHATTPAKPAGNPDFMK